MVAAFFRFAKRCIQICLQVSVFSCATPQGAVGYNSAVGVNFEFKDRQK
jgi:hypothetical protein